MYYDVEKSSRRIRELRAEAGCTQEFVADHIGISLDGYRKLERGVNGAKVDTLVAIAKLYGVSLDYLVYGHEIAKSDAVYKREHRVIKMTDIERNVVWNLLNMRYKIENLMDGLLIGTAI